MTEPTLPSELVEARHTPLFDYASLPDQLAESHRTTVWAELIVHAGTVRYTDLAGDTHATSGSAPVTPRWIAPSVERTASTSDRRNVFIQFYRARSAHGPRTGRGRFTSPLRPLGASRGRDLNTAEEIAEMVVRQYVDVVQDELLKPYFNFAPGFIDWQAHIESVADYWCHVLLYAPQL